MDPDDNRFAAIRAAYEQIDGMTSMPSAHLFHLLLSEQEQRISGPLLEIGAYKGKSAMVLAHHVRPNERLDLVDIHPYLETAAFAPFADRYKLHIGDSERLQSLLPDYGAQKKRYRFIHSDASHTFANVVNDVEHAEKLLHPQGVLSIDDYENPNYPQVPLAVGATIYKRNELVLFLVMNNKGYLCRPAERERMMSLVVNDLAPIFYERYNLVMACTDLDPRSPICLRPTEPSDEGPVYGASLYGHMINRWRRTPA